MTREKFWKICDHLKKIICCSDYECHVFAVGGCLRSIALETEIKDIDLCVDIPNGGISFAEWLKENGHTDGDIVVYQRYGTAMFRLKKFPDEEIEVVQTRKEQYKDTNSRNPETVYGTLEEDYARRDFTVNAMYLNITRMEYTYHSSDSMYDLKKGIIRSTSDPDIIFCDDALRIMRAVRFQAQLGFTIETKTLEGMKKNSYRLKTIVRERITDEFVKILKCTDPSKALCILKEINAFKYILPEFNEIIQDRDLWIHTLSEVSSCDTVLPIRLAKLFKGFGDGLTDHMLLSLEARLKLTRRTINDVLFLHNNRKVFQVVEEKMFSHYRKCQFDFGRKRMSYLLEYIRTDKEFKSIFPILKALEEKQNMYDFKLPLNGDEIMQIKGIESGQMVGIYYKWLLRCAFENPKLTKEEYTKILEDLEF